MTTERYGSQEGAGDTPQISVVVPAYEEEGNVRRLYEAVVESLAPLETTWELLFADDGSKDGTWQEIMALHAEDVRVKGVRLSRNFGHQFALFAGLAHAAGEAVISMDADLQHPPEVLPKLIEEWKRGSKIVHTVRLESRHEGFFKRTSSRLFYRIYWALSGSRVDPGMADFRLLDRQVLDHLLQFEEEGLFLRGLVQWVGFPSAKVAYESHKRYSGRTKYSLSKMVKFAWTGVTSFSLTPLRSAIVVGMMTSFVAFGAIVYAAGAYLLGLPTAPGWASVLSIISFLFGILFILLGIIGEYIGKILLEVKRRPRYLVRDQLGMPLLQQREAADGFLPPARGHLRAGRRSLAQPGTDGASSSPAATSIPLALRRTPSEPPVP